MFVERVRGELGALAMPHARLQFELTTIDLGPTGSDQVDLLFSANPGSAPRSLGKVASGGEMSRVRLAVEVVLAEGGGSVTFVFDEVDAGVGGAVAVEIGRRLGLLARHRQVIVVTHLAQVAAFADRHLVVTKSSDGHVTSSGVVPVDGDGRPELVLLTIETRPGQNAAFYRWARLAPDGTATDWAPWTQLPDWPFDENAGCGVAVGDLDGDGTPELLVLAVDAPDRENAAHHSIGWRLDGRGRPTDGWTAPAPRTGAMCAECVPGAPAPAARQGGDPA